MKLFFSSASAVFGVIFLLTSFVMSEIVLLKTFNFPNVDFDIAGWQLIVPILALAGVPLLIKGVFGLSDFVKMGGYFSAPKAFQVPLVCFFLSMLSFEFFRSNSDLKLLSAISLVFVFVSITMAIAIAERRDYKPVVN